MTRLFVSAAALVDVDGRVLLAQRPKGKPDAGLWELPGGKIEAGETPEAALIRELDEELGVETTESCLAPFAFTTHANHSFQLLLLLYLCRRWRGRPSARVHQALAWVRPQRFGDYPAPPADVPLLARLRDFL